MPCDINGEYLQPGTPPPPRIPPGDVGHDTPEQWVPFNNRAEFQMADFLYRQNQMPRSQINTLSEILAQMYPDSPPPFADHNELYEIIDSIEQGDTIWSSFSISYTGPRPLQDVPPWMVAEYDVWYRNPRTVIRNQLANPNAGAEGFDTAPFREFDSNNKRRYQNFMSGNWAYRQADAIAEDDETHGGMFVPVILGSDKTTVSVATGQNEYYPLYASTGVVHNNVRRAHRGAVSLVAFLAIPKTSREYANDQAFRDFTRQLFHTSLEIILEPLRGAMTTPEVTMCPDGHYRRVIYGLGPYIADYPEQVLLSSIVTGWCPKCTAPPENLDGPSGRRTHEHTAALLDAFNLKVLWRDYGIAGNITPFTASFPRADIHELLSPDLLHQLIKGTFKDHLVTWVEEYLTMEHGAAGAAVVMADIDRRIAAAPSFPGLRRFKEGRGFKQWTGDDSKALMKVFLPAIAGHVPSEMVRAISAFLDFCYLVRRDVIDETTLDAIDDALRRFHRDRAIFLVTGVRNDFSLPRQHSLVHYRTHIELFGAPNGLCSSITESKHIKAVKEPWRRSSHFEALGQMLLTNQRLDKLDAFRADLAAKGLLSHKPVPPPPAPAPPPDDEPDEPVLDGPKVLAHVTLAKCPFPRKSYPRDAVELGTRIKEPMLLDHIRRFLQDQLYPDALPDIPLDACPPFFGKVTSYPSAAAVYYAPSDLSGTNGMRRELIRATHAWRKTGPRYDCVFAEKDAEIDGVQGMHTVRVRLLFSIKYGDTVYPCALIEWFNIVNAHPCEDTGMWIVEPDLNVDGTRVTAVIHLDSIMRLAHLLPVYGAAHLPRDFHFRDTYTSFEAYYVSKFADHHAHEIAF
ncbi:hypothetical protein PLICRDRAFT_87439 [Plicaturopsis crispa FD-325 SS-3]|nr:hypothetical protein PLICRDRAFT_87439 [Plicaturopsis crispa FD-325 SS-3]